MNLPTPREKHRLQASMHSASKHVRFIHKNECIYTLPREALYHVEFYKTMFESSFLEGGLLQKDSVDIRCEDSDYVTHERPDIDTHDIYGYLQWLDAGGIRFSPLLSEFLPSSNSSPISPRCANLAALQAAAEGERKAWKEDHPVCEDPTITPFCDVKAIFKAADMRNIDDLKRECLEHIRKRLQQKIVAYELFSEFARQHPIVTEVICEWIRKEKALGDGVRDLLQGLSQLDAHHPASLAVRELLPTVH